ncbi:MAG TPA: histidine kinase, partial [Usitatibacter sp.]|nr:histidine kinase [Usitatibacter sp.]
MKPVSELLHKTPWWALLASGLALAFALAAFVTPVHIIGLQKSGQTPEQRSAIKREVDLTFSEGAIDFARGIVREMRSHATDPERKAELDEALAEIEQARQDLRQAGAEVKRAQREAGRDVTEAVREASRAIVDAKQEAARALERAGIDPKDVNRSMEESLAATKKAEEDAQRGEAGKTAPAPPAPPAVEPKKKRPRVIVATPSVPEVPDITLSPEERAQIRQKVTGDLWRIGVGSALILIFIPLFILAVVSKFFIDRSRAAQRLAELKKKEAEYHRMTQQVTEAKLSALQAQVEPHFLYNTLASVQALTEVDPQRANEMTGHLIQYLRNALPKMRESVSTVGQEVELVRAYLNILQMRMGKRLSFTIDVPAELMELPFPPLMLPSLVENAIKHGLEPQREGGEVHIRAGLDGETLRMVVADTGRGFGDTPGTGVGLANIRERLAAMYGGRARLTLEANEPHGVVATIEIPRDGARAP